MSARMSIPATPVHANVAFLRIPQFAALSVTEQAATKERLESRARSAIAPLAPDRATVGDFTDTRVRLHSFYTPDASLGSRHRRRLLAYGVGGVAAILLLGVAAREAGKRLFPPLPAVVRFNVRPRGEIFVDG